MAGTSIDVCSTRLGVIGMSVCYDVRFPELARIQALRGAAILVTIWASLADADREPADTLAYRCATRAMENAAYCLGVNRSGRHRGGRFLWLQCDSRP